MAAPSAVTDRPFRKTDFPPCSLLIGNGTGSNKHTQVTSGPPHSPQGAAGTVAWEPTTDHRLEVKPPAIDLRCWAGGGEIWQDKVAAAAAGARLGCLCKRRGEERQLGEGEELKRGCRFGQIWAAGSTKLTACGWEMQNWFEARSTQKVGSWWGQN